MAQVCVLQPASENTENLFSEKQNHTLEFLATHWWGEKEKSLGDYYLKGTFCGKQGLAPHTCSA